jgi:hypothetical protein
MYCSEYKDRLKLVGAYDFFLCEDAVLPMMGKLTGKAFFERKKQPIAVSRSRRRGDHVV